MIDAVLTDRKLFLLLAFCGVPVCIMDFIAGSICVCVCVIPTLMLALSDRLIYVWIRVLGNGKKGPVSAACQEGVEIRDSCH